MKALDEHDAVIFSGGVGYLNSIYHIPAEFA